MSGTQAAAPAGENPAAGHHADGTLRLEGAVTLDTVPQLIAAIDGKLEAGAHTVDFSGVSDIDSSAVALALEWRRHAAAKNLQLALVNIPQAMQNLANLYGVSELVAPAPR